MPVMTDDFAAAAEALRTLLAHDSTPELVDYFIDLVESLSIVSMREAREWEARTKALADVGAAAVYHDIALASVKARRKNTPRDFLRQFRDLKRLPTRRRLLNILARDKDDNDLRPAESAIRFAILRLEVFGDDVPPNWIERLDNTDLLRKIAKTVCDHFAYKVDHRGRPRNQPLEDYAERLAEIYGELTGKAITYAKATDTSRGRKAGELYGPGLDFMLAGLRLIEPASTPFQAAAQIDRLRTANREAR
jgi:hypothetical protein